METLIENAAVFWFIAGFVLLVLEFIVPGLILFFFGIGACLTGISLLLFHFSFNTQLLIFLGGSVLTLVLFRRSLKRIMYSKSHKSELLEDEFLGKSAIAETAISPGKDGKVEFKGTSWAATSDEFIEKNTHVTIIGQNSIVLIVKPKT